MASLLVYDLAKRHNSTKQPTGGTGTSITVQLKGGSDILTPVFLLNVASVPHFNYFEFEGRYYFVTDVKNVRNELWEVSGKVDVLGTYKAVITAASAYVLYYTHANTKIADKRLSVEANASVDSASGSFALLGTSSAAVLTVVGEDRVNAYCMGVGDLEDLYGGDFTQHFEDSVDNITDVSGADVASTLIDFARWIKDFIKSSAGSFNYVGTVSENIKSCLIMPVTIGSIGGQPNTPVLIGAIDTGITAYKINGRTMTDHATVSIPWQATDWRRLEPYHEIFLYIPMIGLIQLSASDLIGYSSLYIEFTMDVLSGDSIFVVHAGGSASGPVVYYATTNVATSYAIGSAQVPPSQITNALIGAAGALTGNPMMLASGALGIANSLKPNATCVGSNSGGAILGISGANTVKCYTVFHDTAVTPSSVSAVAGTPYNGVMSLSGVSGYVQTKDASVAGLMSNTEREEINNLMDGGIYIE